MGGVFGLFTASYGLGDPLDEVSHDHPQALMLDPHPPSSKLPGLPPGQRDKPTGESLVTSLGDQGPLRLSGGACDGLEGPSESRSGTAWDSLGAPRHPSGPPWKGAKEAG